MNADITHADFTGRIVIVGFGSIGQGSLPLILRHIETRPENITIITGDARGRSVAESLGVRFIIEPLNRDNYRACLDPLLDSGDFLLNLSVDVSSIDLIRFCREKEALYLDTCIEPWPGGYTDPNLPISARTNYALREQALELRGDGEGAPTAVITHGANPGLVSHLVKQALLDVARDTNFTSP
ncbi:MAG: saccharopine dehydrogenase NADP-binding domain-containing protein, partial [Gammaproteobacteria bacterium]